MMYKLVVLCAVVAAAVAKPGFVYTSPLTTYSTVFSPATTTITKQASSVVHPSPVVYSAPLTYTHFIKKRSPQFFPYVAPATVYSSNYAATPYVHGTTILPAAPVSYAVAPVAYSTAHLIKKRSAPLLPAATVIAPTTYAVSHYFPHAYPATPVFSTPVISAPITYSTHFIKKRSAPFLNTYLAPTSYSHQSRVDIVNHPTPYLKFATYHSPLAVPVVF